MGPPTIFDQGKVGGLFVFPDGPVQFLAGYAGYLHADAFSGNDGIYTGSDGRILEVACWAHARR